MSTQSLFIPRTTIATFAKTPEVLTVLQDLKDHTLLSRAQYNAFDGDIDEIINKYPSGGTPELLILEHDGPIEDLERLAEVSAATTQLIIISSDNDISRYRRLLDQGGADYLFAPVTPELLLGSISRTFSHTENRQAGALVTVFSCGRGSGGSTIAQNTAALISQLPEKRALLLDFDLFTGTTTLTFDLSPVRGLRELLRDPKSISPKEITKLAHERSTSLQILCSPPSLEQGFSVNLDHFVDILDQARTLSDFIIVDMPSGWSLLHSKLLAMSEHTMLVSMADLGSYQTLHNIETLAANLRQNLPPADIVINRWSPATESLISSRLFSETAKGGHLVKVGDFGKTAIAAAEAGKAVAETTPFPSDLKDLFSFVEGLAGVRRKQQDRKIKQFWTSLFGRKQT